ncbi:MAG: phosphoglucosamine mutase [Actinobacteria bacterium]|nr:phosphoglucosamine mutase [Actinomycetota bacterium]
MARAWFGTDGIRGTANERLSADLALRVGRAAALRIGGAPTILIGRDTRRSGPMLEDALAAGIAAAGGRAVRLGVVPTPAVAWAVREHSADGGIVVSASHNPFPDNGIKLFGPDGHKLLDAAEEEVEALLDHAGPGPTGADVGWSEAAPGAGEAYAQWVAGRAGVDLRGLRVVVDCANGAAVGVAPALFAALGADAELIACAPDGANINVDCGSTHLDHVATAVRAAGADLGIAFDGDADRVLFCTGAGDPVDGDHVLAILARDLLARGALPGNRVVVTSMANLGAHRALAELGCVVEVTDVGDRYVLEAMLRDGAALGGEQSGHVIALDHQTTGDGPLTAVLVLAALARSGQSLAEATALVEKYPQRLISVRADRTGLGDAAAVHAAVREAEAELGDEGRVVLRASGTESLVRVMVEARDAAVCERIAVDLATLVERELPVTG